MKNPLNSEREINRIVVISHRKISTQEATIEYASSVPILIILTNCVSSNIAARMPIIIKRLYCLVDHMKIKCVDEPVRSPAESVPMIGVWNRELTLPIHLKINPSEAMA